MHQLFYDIQDTMILYSLFDLIYIHLETYINVFIIITTVQLLEKVYINALYFVVS